LILFCSLCKAQEVKFKFYLTRACSNLEVLDTSYSLTPINQLDTSFVPKAGTTHLPKAGRYLISFTKGPVLDSPIINIRDTGLYVFKYLEPKIQLYVTGAFDSPPIYVKCDTPLNGYQEGFYANGNLKMRGDFVSGYTKDSLVTFYPSGKMQKRIIVLPKTTNINEYDSLGNLTKTMHNENKSFMTYWQYKWIMFYPGGKVKTYESSIKHVIKIEEFYPTGQLKVKQTKSYRTEYYKNGVKSITYTWKSKKDDIERNVNKFTVYKKEFNEKGQMRQASIFEYWNCNGLQPKLNISDSNWIVSIKNYENGKEIAKVKDIETKEYLEKHPDSSN
jgi:hypothetical protein